MKNTKKNCSVFLKSQDGFTLVEAIVVMLVIAALAAIAIPNFIGFTDSSIINSSTNDLVSAFNLAKSEAVTRGTNVTVCVSNNQATCTGGPNWEQGWIVFTDDDGDGAVDAGAPDNDTVLRVFQPPGRNVTMTGAGNLVNRITYANTGFAGFLGNVTVTTGGALTLQVVTNNIGRVRTQQL